MLKSVKILFFLWHFCCVLSGSTNIVQCRFDHLTVWDIPHLCLKPDLLEVTTTILSSDSQYAV